MKKITLLIYFVCILAYSQTPITDANFQTAINTCLNTNSIDGLCTSSEYGAMPSWDVSQVTNMSEAFAGRTSFNADISAWNVDNVTNMFYMFTGASSFNQNIGSWNVSNVIDMSYLFVGATSFNQDIGDWNVSNVNNMFLMFAVATSFNQDISLWNVSNVTIMKEMFSQASSFNQNISSWDVSEVTNMDFIFDDTSLSTENYDALLINWSTLSLQQNVTLGASGINYCNSQTARQNIIDNFGWTIIDAGFDCSSLSVPVQSESPSFSIYPNPTNNILFIKSDVKALKISIFSALGKKVKSADNKNQISVADLSKGLYIISVSNGINQNNQKFIKL